MEYTTEYTGDDETGFDILDPDGDLVLNILDGGDASTVVEHLNAPMHNGGYTIEDPEEEESTLYSVIDPEGEPLLSSESRSELEDLLTHLNRML